MIYDVDFFISKFEAIPEKLWCIETRSNGVQRCALGWCYPTHEEAKKSEMPLHIDNPEDCALRVLVRHLNPSFGAGGINNGIYWQYQQPTPKQRILAALYDIKKMLSKGQEVQASVATKMSKETEAGTKIIHHYHKVTVDSSIETKELILS